VQYKLSYQIFKRFSKAAFLLQHGTIIELTCREQTGNSTNKKALYGRHDKNSIIAGILATEK
jgi:hypothetical protein